jgi:acyl-CoA synthetase (AMP-forming)/AMP-acid ligase II
MPFWVKCCFFATNVLPLNTVSNCISKSMTRHFLEDFPIAPGVSLTDTSTTTHRFYDRNDINQRCDAVASGLTKLNLPANSRIAVLGTCSFEFATLNVGIYRARHCVVPINFKVPQEQIDFCFKDSGAVLAFCDPAFRHMVPNSVKCIEFCSDDYYNFLCNDTYTMQPYNGDYGLAIIYTSGTTGFPKGVVTSYSARCWYFTRGQEELGQPFPASSLITVSPLYHMAGLNNVELVLFSSKSESNHLIMMPMFNARGFIELIGKYRPAVVKLVAPMMSMVLMEQDLLATTDTTSVEQVSLTSSFTPKKLQDEVKKFFPNVRQVDTPYGTTETSIVFGPHPHKIPKPDMSVGYPADGVDVRIDDAGVLQVRSPAILSHYNNRPELNNTSMTPDGYYITGDLFRVNKYGFYFYIGRADDMFKSGGEKIYPSEVEAVIERHPDILISTVVGVVDEIKGHKPYAFVQLKPGHTADAEEIKEFVIKNVATYQIPRQVWILDELPKTNMGKIDRKALTSLAEQLLQSTT